MTAAIDFPRTALFALICLLLFAALHIAPFLADSEHRRKHGKPLLAPTWSVWHLLYAGEAILLLLLLMTGVYYVALTAVAYPLGLSVDRITTAISASNFADPVALVWFFLPATVLQNVAFFVVPATVIAGFYGTRLRDIGLPPTPPRRAVVAGLLLGVVFLLASGAIGYALESVAKQFDHVPAIHAMLKYEATNPVAQMATTLRTAGVAGLFWGFLAVAVAAPLGEEMLFRGFAQGVLAKRFGAGAGVVLSALLFAAPHTYSPIGLAVIFMMGIALAHVYRVSGSLWTVIIIHAVNNGAQILFAYFSR